MLDVLNFKQNKFVRKDFEQVIIFSFPSYELPNMDRIFDHAYYDEKVNIEGYYENSQFIGATLTITIDDVTYLNLLAVHVPLRNKGYGSQILEMVKAKYKTVYLAYEEVDDKYKDNEQRIKRRNFYYKNGFKDIDFKVKEYFVTYQVASNDENLKMDIEKYRDNNRFGYSKITRNLFFRQVK